MLNVGSSYVDDVSGRNFRWTLLKILNDSERHGYPNIGPDQGFLEFVPVDGLAAELIYQAFEKSEGHSFRFDSFGPKLFAVGD